MLNKNMRKKGWIKIVEAFISILLVTGVLLVVIQKGYIGKEDISEAVYENQISVLREIELDSTMRQEILNSTLPVSGEDIPNDIKEKVNSRMPDYLECEIRICAMNEICAMQTYIDQEVYAQSVAVTATLETYDPRQLKLFCWVR
jgi:hypothetical protein